MFVFQTISLVHYLWLIENVNFLEGGLFAASNSSTAYPFCTRDREVSVSVSVYRFACEKTCKWSLSASNLYMLIQIFSSTSVNSGF